MVGGASSKYAAAAREPSVGRRTAGGSGAGWLTGTPGGASTELDSHAGGAAGSLYWYSSPHRPAAAASRRPRRTADAAAMEPCETTAATPCVADDDTSTVATASATAAVMARAAAGGCLLVVMVQVCRLSLCVSCQSMQPAAYSGVPPWPFTKLQLASDTWLLQRRSQVRRATGTNNACHDAKSTAAAAYRRRSAVVVVVSAQVSVSDVVGCWSSESTASTVVQAAGNAELLMATPRRISLERPVNQHPHSNHTQ